ncbi:hypothetical protein EBB59_01510 [Lysobacter pythonis]|uniref:Uncharacterized protein n=1 Tax=Solilutibacter pythonis TaxID=2483112 RepID=A0A3M2HXF2_9GAMM|nr:hypothetical protein [Lysobacter pythonis]RMH94401.1 hypothetical protein EBB59_01510 [Lysobacter pythonis]
MNDPHRHDRQGEQPTKRKPFKARAFKDLKAWQLAVLGGLGVFASSLTAYFLAQIWPLYVEAIGSNEALSWLGLVVSAYLGMIASAAFLFTAVSKRCGELLYRRHFD